jgi:hypothetical protein
MRRVILAAAAAAFIAVPAEATVTTTYFSLDDPIFHSASGTFALDFDGTNYSLSALDLTVGPLHFDPSNAGVAAGSPTELFLGGDACGVTVISENIGCFTDDFMFAFDPTSTLQDPQIEYQLAGVETRSFANVVLTEVAAPAGVPEPSTWAMILLGFGAIGTAMRRKRKVAAIA